MISVAQEIEQAPSPPSANHALVQEDLLTLDSDVRVYRGATLEQLLPQIRAELGPDAVVLRQRDGLMGGIGGFFQRGFVEVEARAGSPRIDVYDDSGESAFDEAPAPELRVPAPAPEATVAEPAPMPAYVPTSSFAEELAAADGVVEATWSRVADKRSAKKAPAAKRAPKAVPAKAAKAKVPAAKPAPLPTPASAAKRPAAPRPRRTVAGPQPAKGEALRARAHRDADRITAALVAQGLSESFAAEVVADASAHVLAFAPKLKLKDAVRRTIAQRILTPAPRTTGGRTIAFVGAGGAGKTRCVAGLAAAYAASSTMPVVCIALASTDGGAELARVLEGHEVAVESFADGARARTRVKTARREALVVLDTPSLATRDASGIAALATQLDPLALDEVQLALPATLSIQAARELLERLAPLQPTAIAITHADETDQIAVAVELACTAGLPLAYVNDGLDLPGALAPVDPGRLAEALLP
jgi:flagellar biosynthesis protein FlhF